MIISIIGLMTDYIPIQIDKSHLSTIGERLYSQSLDLIRELVANAYDADATEVKIRADKDLIIVEDNGSGMDRDGIRQYLTIGSQFKKENQLSSKFKRVRIGEFGIGKFAVHSVCDRFEIYTKSGDYTATLIFNRNDFENRDDWNVPIIEHDINNDPNGTRVSLFSKKREISLFDIERHLIHIFPLNDKNFSIFLNDAKVQSKFVTGERFKIRETTLFGPIRGEIILSSLLLSKEAIGVGIRVKGILIKRETFDIENAHDLSIKKLTGEVNADFLPITASRDEFITDTEEYKEFEKIMRKKLKRVIKSIKKSAISYQDKKAEQMLSEALLTIREALKHNKNILLLDTLPLFSKHKNKLANQEIQNGIVATSLTNGVSKKKQEKQELRDALKKIKPKARSRIKTLLRDQNRIVKKVRIGGSDFLVSFTKFGEDERESFTEGGIIYINRDHPLFKLTENKAELALYHLIRLIAQEIIKLTDTRNLETAYDWQGRLIKDVFGAAER